MNSLHAYDINLLDRNYRFLLLRYRNHKMSENYNNYGMKLENHEAIKHHGKHHPSKSAGIESYQLVIDEIIYCRSINYAIDYVLTPFFVMSNTRIVP